MNVLKKLKAMLSDNRVVELEAKIEAMKSEHHSELVYTQQHHEHSKEVLTGERDAARAALRRFVSSIDNLMKSHGGDDGANIKS
jgi:hypothetical protein